MPNTTPIALMRPTRRPTHAAQSLDSNAALGNIDLGYAYHWWDGAVLPIGLGLSLVMNSIFFAKMINEMEVLTLADVYARKFGPAVEVRE